MVEVHLMLAPVPSYLIMTMHAVIYPPILRKPDTRRGQISVSFWTVEGALACDTFTMSWRSNATIENDDSIFQVL